MPKGGARSRSGPPPDPNALRRERDAGEWTTIPADARVAEVPDWPLPNPIERERELWTRLWALPQSVMWERYSQHDLVALYVRRFAEAEDPGAPVVLSTLVRQLADSLGLTVPGARANRWRIVRTDGQVEPAAPKPTEGPGASPSNVVSMRDRVKKVVGGRT